MKDKRWIFSIVDNEKKQSIPVKATIKTKTQDEAPKDLSDKDIESLEKGVNIGDRWLESKNRWGETVRYKEYFIVTDDAIDGVKYVASELF